MIVDDTVHNLCERCSTQISDSIDTCPTCFSSVGAPNVRSCKTQQNINALEQRYSAAKIQCELNGYAEMSNSFEYDISSKSSVVVSIDSNILVTLVTNKTVLYNNYENLVGSGVRMPALSDDDKKRFGVSGTLFGSYSGKIIYGVLSLDGSGLSTYGNVFCRLKNIAIAHRTTFLESNSYSFVEKHEIVAGQKIPLGYACSWEDRHKLAISKLHNKFSEVRSSDEFQKVLLVSDSKNRKNDEFIEAHVYGTFNSLAIDSIRPDESAKTDRRARLNLRIINEELGVQDKVVA